MSRALIHRLGVPFDVTVHDYFAICPQVNLLPWPHGALLRRAWAGRVQCLHRRPAIATAPGTSCPGGAATRWLFLEADRVICPSEDVRARLATSWPRRQGGRGAARAGRRRPLGAGIRRRSRAASCASRCSACWRTRRARRPSSPWPRRRIPPNDRAASDRPRRKRSCRRPLADRIVVSGEYAEAELPALLAQVKPHVVWFPAQWPETYSYTLSAAIDAGLPVVATRIGAFRRAAAGAAAVLAGRSARLARGVAALLRRGARGRLPAPQPPARAGSRPAVGGFLRADHYLARREAAIARDKGQDREWAGGSAPRRSAPASSWCRSAGQRRSSARAPYIRLLQPLDHPAIGGGFDIVLADAEEALRYAPISSPRSATRCPDLAAADALAAHCRRTGATLAYDLDDDLLHIPRDHPDATAAAAQGARWCSGCCATPARCSSPHRRSRRAWQPLRDDALVVPNGLDERLWATAGGGPPAAPRASAGRCGCCAWAPPRTAPISP